MPVKWMLIALQELVLIVLVGPVIIVQLAVIVMLLPVVKIISADLIPVSMLHADHVIHLP